MNTTRKAIAALAATAALLGLGISASSAAGNGFGNGFGMMASGTQANAQRGFGMMASGTTNGRGFGMMSSANRGVAGCTGTGIAGLASGTLTAAEKDALVALVGEEKLAHDVYVTLAAKYPTLYQFARIQNSEAQHQAALDALLVKYGLTDPNTGKAVGEFASNARKAQYESLVASAKDTASALAVGVAIEKLDIADLADLLKTVTAPDVKQVLTMLDRASDMHLAAFGG